MLHSQVGTSSEKTIYYCNIHPKGLHSQEGVKLNNV